MFGNRKQPSWGIPIPDFGSASFPIRPFAVPIDHLYPTPGHSHTLRRLELEADHLQTPSSQRTGDLLLLYGLSVRDAWDLFKGSEKIDGKTTCHPQIPCNFNFVWVPTSYRLCGLLLPGPVPVWMLWKRSLNISSERNDAVLWLVLLEPGTQILHHLFSTSFLVCFENGGLLCSSGWPGNLYVAQAKPSSCLGLPCAEVYRSVALRF